MPDWVQYVRRNLPLDRLRQPRADEIVEDLARQFEDFYREALARGMSDDEAATFARRQIPDWESLTSDIYRTNQTNGKPRLDKWQEKERWAGAP